MRAVWVLLRSPNKLRGVGRNVGPTPLLPLFWPMMASHFLSVGRRFVRADVIRSALRTRGTIEIVVWRVLRGTFVDGF